MKTTFAIVKIYNTGYADIITETGTEFTNKSNAESFIMMMRVLHKDFVECGYTHDKNGDVSYTFTKL